MRDNIFVSVILLLMSKVHIFDKLIESLIMYLESYYIKFVIVYFHLKHVVMDGNDPIVRNCCVEVRFTRTTTQNFNSTLLISSFSKKTITHLMICTQRDMSKLLLTAIICHSTIQDDKIYIARHSCRHV